eukprot:gene17254-8815_t
MMSNDRYHIVVLEKSPDPLEHYISLKIEDYKNAQEQVTNINCIIFRSGRSKIATWNVQTLYQAGKLDNVLREVDRMKINCVDLCEVRWPGDGVVIKDTKRIFNSRGTKHYNIGGSLLLAGKHLCVFPNLANLKKDEVSKLQKTLEEGSVSIDIPRRKANESEYIQMKFPLDCTLWALAESTKEQNEVAKNPWMQLADHFDLVYDLSKEYKLPDDIEKVQITEILREAVGYENHSEIKHNDLRTFAKIARTQRVTFSENASKMIRSFFLASRRARNTSLIGSEIGKKSLQTMLSIAAAHAKLSLRKEVTVDDAIIAITFYEECITIKTVDLDHFIVQKNNATESISALPRHTRNSQSLRPMLLENNF